MLEMATLSEKKIEDIIYSAPWLIGNRYIISDIMGSSKEKGRQVRVGSKFIDLLFKDTIDNRPVIIELKKGPLKRVDIAQILEYRALIVTLADEEKIKWEEAFEINYYLPKLILIGSEAPEEVRISANLAGIEIREFGSEADIRIDFSKIEEIPRKLESWNIFMKSGNRNLEDREDWIEKIYKWCSDLCVSSDDLSITKLAKTTYKNGWIENVYFPFLNIGIQSDQDNLIGIYEYFGSEQKFDEENFYIDFYFDISNEYSEDEIKRINRYILSEISKNGYNIYSEIDDYYTITLSRVLLENEHDFKNELSKIILTAKEIKDNIFSKYI